MKPIILITIYRRYRELIKCLENIHELKKEFKESPQIVVVWACPVLGNLWFFEKLIREGKINHLVLRHKNNDGGPTTFPESLNLRLGLEFIEKNYEGQEFYVIGQACDIFPNSGTYKLVDTLLHEKEKAVLFFWENGIARENVWHTNFFAISNDRNYWPPLSDKNEADTLEVQWGKQLANKNLPFYRTHNSRCLKFTESNLDQLNLALIPRKGDAYINLNIMGYKSLWRRIREFIKRILWR
jgi:hypothetical protein